MSKKPKIYWLFIWSSIALSFTNCIFYKTVNVPVNQFALSQYLDKKPMWTIRDVDRRTEAISNVVMRSDTIYGKISSGFLLDHPEGKQSYRKGKGENSRNYLHLITNSPEFSNDVKLSLSEVTSATTHETDKGKTMLVNVGLIFLIILIL